MSIINEFYPERPHDKVIVVCPHCGKKGCNGCCCEDKVITPPNIRYIVSDDDSLLEAYRDDKNKEIYHLRPHNDDSSKENKLVSKDGSIIITRSTKETDLKVDFSKGDKTEIDLSPYIKKDFINKNTFFNTTSSTSIQLSNNEGTEVISSTNASLLYMEPQKMLVRNPNLTLKSDNFTMPFAVSHSGLSGNLLNLSSGSIFETTFRSILYLDTYSNNNMDYLQYLLFPNRSAGGAIFPSSFDVSGDFILKLDLEGTPKYDLKLPHSDFSNSGDRRIMYLGKQTIYDYTYLNSQNATTDSRVEIYQTMTVKTIGHKDYNKTFKRVGTITSGTIRSGGIYNRSSMNWTDWSV